MSLNPIIGPMGRRLRLAVIGGEPGPFIGAMHRQAARIDDRYESIAGVLSSNPEKARITGLELGLPLDRTYANAMEMIEKEAARKDGADVIATINMQLPLVTNDQHNKRVGSTSYCLQSGMLQARVKRIDIFSSLIVDKRLESLRFRRFF